MNVGNDPQQAPTGVNLLAWDSMDNRWHQAFALRDAEGEVFFIGSSVEAFLTSNDGEEGSPILSDITAWALVPPGPGEPA